MSNLPTSHGVPFRSAISAARALAHDVVGEMGCGKQHGNLRPGAWIEEDLAEVFLVGHSYAGMVITGVAAKAAERLKLLIYLDAYIPADGQSESDLWSPERRAIAEAAEAAASGLAQPPPPALFGVTDPALAAWITARMTPHPVATYTEPAPPGNATSAAVPRVFIHCTAIPPTPRMSLARLRQQRGPRAGRCAR